MTKHIAALTAEHLDAVADFPDSGLRRGWLGDVARMLEHHAKRILQQAGIPIPEGYPASSSDEAATIAERIGGPVVIKALVPVGKRGQAGAVRFAEDSRAAATAARELIGSRVGNYRVDTVLVEQRIEVGAEHYVAIVIDRDARTPRLIVSRFGGVDIEEVAREKPDAVASMPISMSRGLLEFQAREIWGRNVRVGYTLPLLGQLTRRLWNLFIEYDARLLEINPLFITTDARLVAGDAVLSIDDAAMFRHPELARITIPGVETSWRPMTELEAEARRVHEADPYRGSARYLELDGGDIGFLCGGGGASLLLFDSLVRAGGQPANYAEIGGNPTEEKVAGMTRVVVSKSGVRGLFIGHNITNNTQVDVIARGVVEGLRRAGRDPRTFPVVAREAGLHDEEGRRIFASAGITYYGEETTLSQAARKVVEIMRAGDAT